MTRGLAALLAALALASACRSPTAPEWYAGACELGVPRQQIFVHICYNVCPRDAERFAAGADMAYTALGAPCGTGAP